MKVLHLTLKRKWFEMIASGEKKEEYREIKDYWICRLTQIFHDPADTIIGMPFTEICFKNGYGKNAPTISVKYMGIKVGKPNPNWTDNCQDDVFIISLGNIITKN